MKKLSKRLLLVVMIIALISSVLAIAGFNTVSAASVSITGSDTPHSLTITRNITKITNPVTNTFSYTITPASTNPAGATNEPTTASVVFTDKAPNALHVATQTGVVDFTGATYQKVGDYKYTLTETGSTDSSTFPAASDTSYDLFVSVRYEVDEHGVQTGNLVSTLASQAVLTGETDKTDIVFPNTTNFTYITVSKNVTGNMADKNEYFKFKLTINGNTGDEYTIAGQSASVTYQGTTVTTTDTYTVKEAANNFMYVYLKHGDVITIGKIGSGTDEIDQIKSNVTYELVEQDATTYETFVNGSTTDSKNSGTLTTVKDPDDNKASFVNSKTEATLTGVFFEIAPYVVAILVASIGIVFFAAKRKNNDD